MGLAEQFEKIMLYRKKQEDMRRMRYIFGDHLNDLSTANRNRILRLFDIAKNVVMPTYYKTVWTEEDLKELCFWLKTQPMVAVDTETMGLEVFKDEIVGISFYAPNQGWYIPLKHWHDIGDTQPPDGVIGIDYIKCLPKSLVSQMLKPILEDRTKKFLFHNAKFDLHILHNWMGIDMMAYFDTMIAQALLDENVSKALKELAPRYLNIPADRFSTLFGATTFDRVPIKLDPKTRSGNLASYYAIKDTELTYKLYQFQMKWLSHPVLANQLALLFDIEMPFLHIVWEAEQHGVFLDTDYLGQVVGPQLKEEYEALEAKIREITGDINLKSPPQLADVLYNQLGLEKINKKKPMSTDKKTLKKLKAQHAVAGLLLDFRSKVKLYDAFANKLPGKVDKLGRIHTTFNTAGTKTGRMSSSDPNLQQMPNGNLIRNAFLADEGRLLVSIDFSGQELRVLTHCSMDEVLLRAYANGEDIHSKTATGMWNMKHPDEQVTYEYFEYCRDMTGLFRDADGNLLEDKLSDIEYLTKLLEEGKINDLDVSTLRKDAEYGVKFEKIRKEAKVVNFGIIYGMSESGLADTLDIDVEEARLYIQSFFETYPGVKRWMAEERSNILNSAPGYFTQTLMGRKRRVYPEVTSGVPWKLAKGFRMGINAIIQGSSADMIKMASIKLQPLLKQYDSRIVLWIHDELILDVPEDIGMENLQKFADCMCNALPLICGMKSDIEVGRRWGQKMSEDEIKLLFRAQLLEEEEEDDDEGDEVDESSEVS